MILLLLLVSKSFFDYASYLDIGNIFVTEVTDFKSEVRFDLRGCLEAVVASEAAIRDKINNMHLDMYVISRLVN